MWNMRECKWRHIVRIYQETWLQRNVIFIKIMCTKLVQLFNNISSEITGSRIDDKDIKIIKEFDSNQSADVRFNIDQFKDTFAILNEVRQGCIVTFIFFQYLCRENLSTSFRKQAMKYENRFRLPIIIAQTNALFSIIGNITECFTEFIYFFSTFSK